MKNKLLLIIVICFITGISSYSQMHRKIVIDSAIYDPDMPVLEGTVFPIKLRLHLTDSANNFVSGGGNIRYWVKSDSMNLNGSEPALMEDGQGYEGIPMSGRFDTLHLVLDSLDLRISSTGPINVIIIWPAFAAPGIILQDSGFIFINKFVYSDIGIDDQDDIPPTTIYPNPSGSFELLYIKKYYAQLIDQIAIIDHLGQPVFVKQFGEEDESHGYVVPTFGLTTGMYTIQIYYKDKKTETIKYIKN